MIRVVNEANTVLQEGCSGDDLVAMAASMDIAVGIVAAFEVKVVAVVKGIDFDEPPRIQMKSAESVEVVVSK